MSLSWRPPHSTSHSHRSVREPSPLHSFMEYSLSLLSQAWHRARTGCTVEKKKYSPCLPGACSSRCLCVTPGSPFCAQWPACVAHSHHERSPVPGEGVRQRGCSCTRCCMSWRAGPGSKGPGRKHSLSFFPVDLIGSLLCLKLLQWMENTFIFFRGLGSSTPFFSPTMFLMKSRILAKVASRYDKGETSNKKKRCVAQYAWAYNPPTRGGSIYPRAQNMSEETEYKADTGSGQN